MIYSTSIYFLRSSRNTTNNGSIIIKQISNFFFTFHSVFCSYVLSATFSVRHLIHRKLQRIISLFISTYNLTLYTFIITQAFDAIKRLSYLRNPFCRKLQFPYPIQDNLFLRWLEELFFCVVLIFLLLRKFWSMRSTPRILPIYNQLK